MKTLLVGIALGVGLKYLWDSEYGDDLRARVYGWWDDVTDKLDQGIHKAEAAVEKVAEKVDKTANI